MQMVQNFDRSKV